MEQELDQYLAEAETLKTSELIVQEQIKQEELNKSAVILGMLLSDTALQVQYGNKTIKSHEELLPLLKAIPTGSDKDVIQLAMRTRNCSYHQAVTKMAVAFNINYEHDTWFKQQWHILQHNRNLLNTPVNIVKFNRLHKKMHGIHMHKYFKFLLDLFQTQLEEYGISYSGNDNPTLASASFSFITKVLKRTNNISEKHVKTTKKNMNTIARLMMTKKLSDKEVEELDPTRFEKVKALTRGWRRTITTYEMILWSDFLLEQAEHTLLENKEQQVTHKGQNSQMFKAVGSGDVFNKANPTMDPTDKANINSLLKWARKKVFEKGGCGFITKDDWDARIKTIGVGTDKSNSYKTIVLSRLNLKATQATKRLKATMQSNKLNKVDYHSYVYVPAEIVDSLK